MDFRFTAEEPALRAEVEASVKASMAKPFGSEMTQRAGNILRQLYGGWGQLRPESPVNRLPGRAADFVIRPPATEAA